jgi:predicted enzyme related to lactoylglutathione lyase
MSAGGEGLGTPELNPVPQELIAIIDARFRTPDGHSKLELSRYHAPAAAGGGSQDPPPNTLGLHRVMFAVDDINDTVGRLRAHGAELLGEVAQYESIFLLCYLRGPAGIIVALAEQIG